MAALAALEVLGKAELAVMVAVWDPQVVQG